MEQEFTDWFEANETRFAHGQFDDKNIAYSAWIEGKKVVNKNCTISVDYLVDILKRTLSGNDEVKVEFDNEEDNINYILDVCNNFKRELEKDYP